MVHRVCRDVLGDPHAAQDAPQAAFLVPARRAKGIGRPRRLGGRARRGVLPRFLSEDRPGRRRNSSGYEFVSREGAGEWAGRRPRLLVVGR